MRLLRLALVVCVALVAASSLAWAQRRWRGSRHGEGRAPDGVRTAREVESHSTGTPAWTNPRGFEHDAFTFVRVQYDHGGGGWGAGWQTDLPDSDLNLSYRLQQITSILVDPDGRILRLTDPELSGFPFLYLVEPGGLWLSDAEVDALRKYLLNGGFLMLDDFWGESEWDNCAEVMKRVFPEREFTELPLDHPLYQRPFQIREKGQVPNYRTGENSRYTGVTWERSDAREVHHRGISDDQGRLMVLATHNTDNGDGWEREGEYHYFFENFSEKFAYPLGINIIFYTMTH